MQPMPSVYRFQLLRYSPNRLSEEFYNIAVLLYAEDGRLLDARFAPDFVRLRCHPLADLPFLQHLKDDFENRRLEGEGFTLYTDELTQNLSQSLHLSGEKAFLGEDALEEIERLTRTYLATPKRSEVRSAEPLPGARRWILARVRDTLQTHGVLDRVESNVAVGAYVSPRFSFQLDYAYKPNGRMHYIQALSLHHDLNDAGRLCFVFDRIRSQVPADLTAVFDDILPEPTRELLGTSHIQPWAVSSLDELAMAVRKDLGMM